MHGQLTKSATGDWCFDADEGTHHEIHVAHETDESGTYLVKDTHGRDWTLIDGEDRAEMLEGWSE